MKNYQQAKKLIEETSLGRGRFYNGSMGTFCFIGALARPSATDPRKMHKIIEYIGITYEIPAMTASVLIGLFDSAKDRDLRTWSLQILEALADCNDLNQAALKYYEFENAEFDGDHEEHSLSDFRIKRHEELTEALEAISALH